MAESIVRVRPNLKNLVRFGYDFTGWAYTNNASAPDFAADGNTVSPSEFVITSNVTLYAVWLIKPLYYVKYVPNWPVGETGSGNVPTDVNSYFNGDPVTVQANSGNLLLAGYTFLGWLHNTALYSVIGVTVTPPTLTVPGENVILSAVWSKNAQGRTYIHYGTLENSLILIRAAYVAEKRPAKAEKIEPVLLELLVMASDWVNGEFSALDVPVPLLPVPDGISGICELYAAGLFLQREIPEERTHSYITQAKDQLASYIAKKYGVLPNGQIVDTSTTRRPIIVTGKNKYN
jgi:hypothetical protein